MLRPPSRHLSSFKRRRAHLDPSRTSSPGAAGRRRPRASQSMYCRDTFECAWELPPGAGPCRAPLGPCRFEPCCDPGRCWWVRCSFLAAATKRQLSTRPRSAGPRGAESSQILVLGSPAMLAKKSWERCLAGTRAPFVAAAGDDTSWMARDARRRAACYPLPRLSGGFARVKRGSGSS